MPLSTGAASRVPPPRRPRPEARRKRRRIPSTVPTSRRAQRPVAALGMLPVLILLRDRLPAPATAS